MDNFPGMDDAGFMVFLALSFWWKGFFTATGVLSAIYLWRKLIRQIWHG